MKNIIAVFCLMSISLTAIAKDIPTDNTKLHAKNCVEMVLKMAYLPTLGKELGEFFSYMPKSMPPQEYSIDPEIKEIWETINRVNFGTIDFFTLSIYDDSVATINIDNRIVFIGPQFDRFRKAVPSDYRRDLTAAILGHEMGHYFYEVCSAVDPKSYPIFGRRKFEYNDEELTSQGFLHGQVDAIGLFLMENAGFNPQSARNEIEFFFRARRSATDFANPVTLDLVSSERNNVINSYLKSQLSN